MDCHGQAIRSFKVKRRDAYADALARLQKMELVYPCYLTRKELSAVLSAPHGSTAPHATDMVLPAVEMARRAADGSGAAWRLRTDAALAHTGPLHWFDARTGQMVPVDLSAHGDVVVARRDIGTSYHLSVVIDDALDGVTLVTRGADLADSTHVQTGCCRGCWTCRALPICITIWFPVIPANALPNAIMPPVWPVCGRTE